MGLSLIRWLNHNHRHWRKVILLVWLYSLVLALPYILVINGSDLLHQYFGPSWWVAPAVLLFLLATIAPLVYLSYLRRLESKKLRDQRRYHRTLIAASSGMTRIKDMNKLCRLIVHVVSRTVGLTHAGLFLYNPDEQKYHLSAVRHKQMMPNEMVIDKDDPVIQLLRAQKDLLVPEELQARMHETHDPEEAKKITAVYEWMRNLEVKMIVPSFSSDQLLAFLVLGDKKTGERYETDDIAMFSGLANQGALAIENALFFEELRNNEMYLIQSEKLASLGQLASGMAHEIHNPLTIISGESQLYLERFKGKDKEVDQVLRSIIEECQRAADITRRILKFAKPAPGEFSAVDLSTLVEESFTLAGYQMRMDRIERTINIPKELSKVMGNQNQLQEVILNLIMNAAQAMDDTGGKLMISANSINDGMIEIKVEDNGPGIPSNKLTKIFDPFYTTKSNGTGLGLFVTQRIIKLHQGTIDVRSTEGKGTCFIMQLPAWSDVPVDVSPAN